MRVLQASAERPLMRTPHEPQIAARHEQRMAIEASSRSFTWRMPSSTERSGGEVHVVVGPVGGLAGLGVEAADLQLEIGHLSKSAPAGSHWVIVTGE